MKNLLFFATALAAPLALVACGEDRPPTVVHETRTVHHYHTRERSGPVDAPADFEPVERPATYSR